MRYWRGAILTHFPYLVPTPAPAEHSHAFGYPEPIAWRLMISKAAGSDP
jgi:hypothetical protein